MSSLLDLVAKLDTTGTVKEIQSGLTTAKSAFKSATSTINDVKTDMEEAKEDATGLTEKFENWKLDKKFEKVNDDVALTYDEASNTFRFESGKIDPGTMKAFKDYLEEADGKYDESNIVIGEAVDFEQGKLKHINFGFKCKSLDIQSQKITDANSMFEGSEIENITIADQPNLENVEDMFKNCNAATVTMGNIPAGVDKAVMKDNCKATFTTDIAGRVAEAEELASDVASPAEASAEETMSIE